MKIYIVFQESEITNPVIKGIFESYNDAIRLSAKLVRAWVVEENLIMEKDNE